MPTVCRRLLVAATTLAAVAASAPIAHAAPQPGLKAEYFDYTDLTGKVAERIDTTVDFDWDDAEPVPGVGDTFSVRWSGVVIPAHSETYTFITRSDDGVRLWVDGKLVIDDWNMHAAAERSGSVALQAGRAHDIRLEYFDGVKKPSRSCTGRARSSRGRSSRPRRWPPSAPVRRRRSSCPGRAA
jgi:hypothetical protein